MIPYICKSYRFTLASAAARAHDNPCPLLTNISSNSSSNVGCYFCVTVGGVTCLVSTRDTNIDHDVCKANQQNLLGLAQNKTKSVSLTCWVSVAGLVTMIPAGLKHLLTPKGLISLHIQPTVLFTLLQFGGCMHHGSTCTLVSIVCSRLCYYEKYGVTVTFVLCLWYLVHCEKLLGRCTMYM